MFGQVTHLLPVIRRIRTLSLIALLTLALAHLQIGMGLIQFPIAHAASAGSSPTIKIRGEHAIGPAPSRALVVAVPPAAPCTGSVTPHPI